MLLHMQRAWAWSSSVSVQLCLKEASESTAAAAGVSPLLAESRLTAHHCCGVAASRLQQHRLAESRQTARHRCGGAARQQTAAAAAA